MTELPPTEGQMTPLWSDEKIEEYVACVSWPSIMRPLEAVVSDVEVAYMLKRIRDEERAALQQQLAEVERMVSLEMNQAIEIGALRRQLASQNAELTEKQKYVLQLERAVTALRLELADELKAQIEQRKATGLRTLSEEARYRELTGRNYGESEANNANPTSD